MREYGLDANFRYVDAITDAQLLSLYLGYDLCCSEYEDFCATVAEAHSANLPIVTSNRSAVRQNT